MTTRTLLLTALLSLISSTAFAQAINWERHLIDYTFRSEGVTAGDFNKDGKMDIAAGDVWYSAPDWQVHEIRPVGQYYYFKGYSNSFANWTYDINADGWDDIIVAGFPGAPFHWYENPKGEKGHWAEHVIWHSICNETPLFQDITGDGKPEIILGTQPEAQMGYLEIPEPKMADKKWDFVAISEPGDPGKNGTFKYYHGLGTGDINGDGRKDVIIPHGWWEAPKDLAERPWKFHPLVLSESGAGDSNKAADIHVEDLDMDGDNDIMMSSAHAFGVWWFENKGDNKEFQYHLIDGSNSQTHALVFADINNDGQKDLVTGKRFFAHQGNDPGGKEAVLMYWYEITRTAGQAPTFTRHDIAPAFDTGIGTQFQVIDFNGDKHLDLVLSNKNGVNLILQKVSKPKR
ncbi:MAG: VCBS repeat-containing protein [Planctomycetaceae bacterium]|jgi:hypothetical protein|nr:VCBS repeat-containing protein [Planctomycetaceae bacterium]MDG2388477.1 VCBS repeat-containing protein [Planctomycetaceae bacterium]